MKLQFPKTRRLAGFTLTEIMMTCAVGSLMMGGLMAGSMALTRTFNASDRYSRAEGDVNRLVDYVARDIRTATKVDPSVSGSTVLTVTRWDYYDRRGTLTDTSDDKPNAPVLGRYGAVYGTMPVTIKYALVGSRIRRDVTEVDGGVATTTSAWIADDVANFSVTLGSNGVATVSASFATRYGPRQGDIQGATATFSKQIYPRNPRS